MSAYVFNGKVMPERAKVNISTLQVQLDAREAGITGEAIVSVGASQVSVMINTMDSHIDLPTLKNYVEYIVRTVIDAYGYLSGRGYDVEITSAVLPDGNQVVFGVGIRELERAESEWPLPFEELLKAMNDSQHLQRALGDLREAIRSPLDTGFFCYRAVECVRQSFVEEGERSDMASWERLRSALCIDQSFIYYLKKFADPQRHGATPYMSGQDRTSAMQHAWKVIDRFCLYVHGGFVPLAEDKFDVLMRD